MSALAVGDLSVVAASPAVADVSVGQLRYLP